MPLVLSLHDHGRADFDPVVKINDIFVGQTDAARSGRGADGVRLVRAVYAIHRVAEIKGACTERIGGAAAHVTRKVGPPTDHFSGRRPIRPLSLIGDSRRSGPSEAVAADADAVFKRPAFAENQIE